MTDPEAGGERERSAQQGRRLPIGATLLLLLVIALFVWLVDWAGGQLGLGADEPPAPAEAAGAGQDGP